MSSPSNIELTTDDPSKQRIPQISVLSSHSPNSEILRQSSNLSWKKGYTSNDGDKTEENLSCFKKFQKRRAKYEQKPGGRRRLHLHYLTNKFYKDWDVEVGYQEWCQQEQLPNSRLLSAVLTITLIIYHGYSAFKTRDQRVLSAFILRIGATLFFGAIVVLLSCVSFAQKHWKVFLSFAIVVILGVETFYRSVKLSYEGDLLVVDTQTILNSTTNWNVPFSIQSQARSKTFNDVFEKLNEIPPYNASSIASFQTALTLLQDELLLIHSRTWPMWTVIISVVMRIDVYLILPSMLTVLLIYLSLSAHYHRNGFNDGISGDVQTMGLLVGQLWLLMWLAHYNDRFLRWTYIQIVDSNIENSLLRERLTMLGDKRFSSINEDDSEVLITTPMELVLQKLNKIKKVIVKNSKSLSTSLSPVLENVIDILVSQNNSASSSTASATFNQHGLDSDVSSWLINQQGLGDKYVDVVVVFLLWCFWIYFVPFLTVSNITFLFFLSASLIISFNKFICALGFVFPNRHLGSHKSTKSNTSHQDSLSRHSSTTHLLKPSQHMDVSDDVRAFLGDLTSWDLDVLELSVMTNGRPLYVLAFQIAMRYELLSEISCSQQTFANFITAIESGYLKNPYHNSSHAADVLNGCHHFVQALSFNEVLTTRQTFSLLISAAIHDFEHPGVSNNFLVKTKHELAVRYNDDSVCERMHVARAFAVMQKEGTNCNILHGVHHDDYLTMRRNIIETVMVTDLSKHLDYTAQIRSMAANDKNEDIMNNPNYLMQIAIKSSDLGHCAKIKPIHLKW